MSITEIYSENGNHDLSAGAVVLEHTPSENDNLQCQIAIELGSAAKPLSGDGGDYELKILIGGLRVQPSPEVITFSSAVGSVVYSSPLIVPADAEVEVIVESPNSGDDDVEVTARMYDLMKQVSQIKAHTDLITEDREISVSQLSVDGDNLKLYRGESRHEDDGNAYIFFIDKDTVDLTGHTPKFGLTKLVDSDGDDTKEASTVTIKDPGGDSQRIVVEFDKGDTSNLAVDDENVSDAAEPTGRAYRYTLSSFTASSCPTWAQGQLSVRPRDTSCE